MRDAPASSMRRVQFLWFAFHDGIVLFGAIRLNRQHVVELCSYVWFAIPGVNSQNSATFVVMVN